MQWVNLEASKIVTNDTFNHLKQVAKCGFIINGNHVKDNVEEGMFKQSF